MPKLPKVHTGSFFLEFRLLELLDKVAQLEGQSRGVIVERALRFYFAQRGIYDIRTQWKKSKARLYKSAQKVYVTPKRHHALTSRCQKAKNQPKRLVAARPRVGFRPASRRKSFCPSCFAQAPRLFEHLKGETWN
ncbi:ribbon-helix-helix protein, CopG family [Helicobacter baculiformis]|uniref:Ribbon-helix-helix protein, CopG family n=1 Tax=Helicobacter baculiformis TaxID=427351 RepID=A0ABV7ZG27_9HELI|nr:ribbon-helix-helix protein, CopG family [Helicobacter baculiformis]